jgi:hypothetical protein
MSRTHSGGKQRLFEVKRIAFATEECVAVCRVTKGDHEMLRVQCRITTGEGMLLQFRNSIVELKRSVITKLDVIDHEEPLKLALKNVAAFAESEA